MFNHNNWQLLQLFADGAGSGTGAASGEGSAAGPATTGDTSVDAGHQRLRELGVPEARIRKPRAKQPSAIPEGAIRFQNQQNQTAPQAAAANDQKAQTETAPSRMTWDEIVKDPEYNAELQKIIKSRIKDEGQHKAILDTLDPAIKHLAKEHGLDPENVDHIALVNAITGVYEDKALEKGTSKETEMRLDQAQRTLEREKNLKHFQKLEEQGAALKAIYPNFDLRAELRNPVFARLTSPDSGLSVEDAFYAVHRRELQARSMQVASDQTRQMISNAIQSGTHRPDESGTAAQAPSVSKFDYRKATPAQRNAIKAEIRKAAAEGRKVYPGRF